MKDGDKFELNLDVTLWWPPGTGFSSRSGAFAILKCFRTPKNRVLKKQWYKQRARHACIASHKLHHAMKAEALRLHSEGDWRTKTAAVAEITPKIQRFAIENNLEPLSEFNAERTVKEWLPKKSIKKDSTS